MDYENMSDFEINKAVAEEVGLLVQEMDANASLGFTPDFHANYPNVVWVADLDCSTGQQCEPWWQFDPCNNPSDAWPIIVDNRISIVDPISLDKKWSAFVFEDDSEPDVYHENPLRAAMIVYLMMREVK